MDEGEGKEGLPVHLSEGEGKEESSDEKVGAGRSTRGECLNMIAPRLSSGVFASATGRGILEARRPGS